MGIKTDQEKLAFSKLAEAQEAVEALAPTREVALVKTKLDEARLWLQEGVSK